MSIGVENVKKAVNISYSLDDDSELARVFAMNAETGGVSNSNWAKNDGYAVLTYPIGYEGTTVVSVQGNHGAVDEGAIKVSPGDAEVVEIPGEPIDPGEPGETPDPDDPHVFHPIELPVVEHH